MKIGSSDPLFNSASKVQRKSNNTRKIRVVNKKKAASTAMSAPEVMAKVTGFSKGRSHARSNIDYISRNGELEIEDNLGNVIKGGKELKAFSKSWTVDLPEASKRSNQRDTMHLILSMPKGTPGEAVKAATRNFASRTFGANHEYVFVLHSPENDAKTKQPHCHITIKCVGKDGKRLNPRKADLQNYREAFAKAMEEQGYAANATSRAVRGVVKKSIRQQVLHIKERGLSRIEALQIKQAADELKAELQGVASKAKPWLQKIEQRQARIRNAWVALAGKLENQQQRSYANARPDYARSGLSGASRIAPDYGRLDAGRVERVQRRAALYQSGDSSVAGQRQAGTLASVRNLPGSTLVQDQKPSEMLLQSDAQRSLGNRHGGAADPALRRSGVGIAGDAEGRLEAHKGPRSDAELAKAIKQMVEAMPPVETRAEAIKRGLRERFAVKPEIEAVEPAAVHRPTVKEKTPEQQSVQHEQDSKKDLDR